MALHPGPAFAIAFGLAMCCTAAAQSQALQLPLDVGQGVLFPEDGEGPAHRFAPMLAPELRLDAFRVGIPVAASGPAPWRFVTGVRPSLRVLTVFGMSDLSLWIAVQGLVHLPQPQVELQVGTVVELLFLRIGVWGGRLFGATGRWSLLSSIGIDIASLSRLLAAPRPPAPPLPRSPAPVGAASEQTALFRSGVRSRLLGVECPQLLAVAAWVRANAAALDRASSVSGLIALARRAGQDAIASALTQARDAVPQAGDGRDAALAAREGLTMAADEVKDAGSSACP